MQKIGQQNQEQIGKKKHTVLKIHNKLTKRKTKVYVPDDTKAIHQPTRVMRWWWLTTQKEMENRELTERNL